MNLSEGRSTYSCTFSGVRIILYWDFTCCGETILEWFDILEFPKELLIYFRKLVTLTTSGIVLVILFPTKFKFNPLAIWFIFC